MSDNKTHFDKISADYKKASDTWAPVYRQIEALVGPSIRGKEILDIGNGGYFPYDTTLAASVTVLDISPAMLARIDKPNIIKVVGDARTLNSIEDNSVDCVLFILCLHHITGHSARQSDLYLKECMRAARRKLRPGGKLLIGEPVLTGGWYIVERALYGLTRFALSRMKVPMIFFHSYKNFRKALSEVFTESGAIAAHPLKIEGRVDPFGGSFPGKVAIPASWIPTRYFLFEIRKPSSDSAAFAAAETREKEIV